MKKRIIQMIRKLSFILVILLLFIPTHISSQPLLATGNDYSAKTNQKSLVAIVSDDPKSVHADLKFLGVKHDFYDENNLTSLDFSKYKIIIFDYLVGVRGQEVHPSFDLAGWVQISKTKLMEYIQTGGSLIDFSGGEGFILFNLTVKDAHGFDIIRSIKEDDPLFQLPNIFNNNNFTSIMSADAYVTGGADLSSFNILANGTEGAVLLTKRVGSGKILYCSIMQYSSIFRRGFIENILYWASDGILKRIPFEIKELRTQHFRLIYPSFSTSLLKVSETIDFVYDKLVEMAGRSPNIDGAFIIDFTKDLESDFGVMAAGLAGNPTYVDVWQLPELIGSERVLYGIVYHELGHVIFGWADFLKGPFGEAFADIGKYYALDLLEVHDYYAIEEQIIKSQLENYVAQGANFDKITSSILVGIFLTLKDQYGWNIFRNYFRIVDNSSFIHENLSYNERLNLFVHYLSMSVKSDLVTKFREWGFPITEIVNGYSSSSSKNEMFRLVNVTVSAQPPTLLTGITTITLLILTGLLWFLKRKHVKKDNDQTP